MIVFLVLALVGWYTPAYLDLGRCGQQVVDATNLARADAGLDPLLVDREMRRDALGWSREMRADGVLRHSGIAPWGENVGFSLDAATLNAAWMQSPGHRENILDPGYTRMGVGCAWEQGRVWSTVTFW